MEKKGRYNPANIAPEWFLRSPTMVANNEVKALATNLADRMGRQGRLLLGSEFEVLFFSPHGDPGWGVDDRTNPNYTTNHRRTVGKIADDADTFCAQDKLMLSADQYGRLMVEYRTQALSLNETLTAFDRLREHIVTLSDKQKVRPVVYSHHIHASLINPQANLVEDALQGDGSRFRYSLLKTFQSAAPLMQAPEDFRYTRTPAIKAHKQPVRMEFRLLSTEYACDPVLNTLISLYALSNGLQSRWGLEQASNSTPNNYVEAIEFMNQDSDLNRFMGQALVTQLSQIVRHYPAIATRRETLPQLMGSTDKQETVIKKSIFSRIRLRSA